MAKFKLTQAANRERILEVFDALAAAYPDADCSLDYENPLQLMVATILSAQCTDVRVNVVTKDLFAKYHTAEDYVRVPPEELEKDIQTCGFYRQKTKSIQGACQKLLDRHDGLVPDTLDELVKLNGVGRKTANVVLGQCFDTPGVIVDTHCTRLNNRLGFTKNSDPVKIERDIMKILPAERWTLYSHFMVFHGRARCIARAPQCSSCEARELCPYPETREGLNCAR